MWFKCITCEVFARPVYFCAAYSQNIIDVELVQRGLHNQPDYLHQHLQEKINSADLRNYDAVLLSYGLCGKAIDGLVAQKHPLVIPLAHDCITLFLGSRNRYNEQFTNFPGTYWYVKDYIERNDDTGGSLVLGTGLSGNIEKQYQEYVQKFGKDNADYLMDVMGAWQQHYKRAALIDMNIGDTTSVQNQAQEEAKKNGWVFERLTGDINLIHSLLEGKWEKNFLVVNPGQKVSMTFDENIIGCFVNE